MAARRTCLKRHTVVMNRVLCSLSACAAGVLVSLAGAQPPLSQPKIELLLGQKSFAAASKVKASVRITFETGRHGNQNPPSKDYMIPVTVSLKGKDFKLVVTYPKGVARKSGGEREDVMVYEGTVEIPILLDAPARPGPYVLKIAVEYQQCTETDCFPPESVVLSQKVTVLPTRVK